MRPASPGVSPANRAASGDALGTLRALGIAALACFLLGSILVWTSVLDTVQPFGSVEWNWSTGTEKIGLLLRGPGVLISLIALLAVSFRSSAGKD